MAQRDEPGKISLNGIFAAVANELMSAVARGRMLHHTKNIRDSGTPFENAVREQMSLLLPRAFSVHQGFLFDAKGACTPQLDAFLCSTNRAQAIFSAPDGAVYTPFSDAWAIGEIKASSTGMGKHLEQVSNRIRAVKSMQREMHTRGATFPKLTSFLIVGDCPSSYDEDIKKHWGFRSEDFPDFVLLIGHGELIVPPRSRLPIFEDESEEISPVDSPWSGLSVLSSDGDLEAKRGDVLSWFFFALLHRLRLAESHELKIAWSALLTNDNILGSMPLTKVANELSRAADPFSLAVMHKMKLKCIRNLDGASS
ncbi:DUF6602 domain-containing protein [Roseinatronobacter sp. NSM]|uniref:DUF6602 domain-containing protein n=1 Tax=Roseinatronobacter sp. NSM TaxID=3457785 RepID=UPI0040372F2E